MYHVFTTRQKYSRQKFSRDGEISQQENKKHVFFYSPYRDNIISCVDFRYCLTIDAAGPQKFQV